MLTGAQMDELRHRCRRWESTTPPCGISPYDVYSPCLPDQDERGLRCATCGLRQRLEIAAMREDERVDYLNGTR